VVVTGLGALVRLGVVVGYYYLAVRVHYLARVAGSYYKFKAAWQG